MYYTSIHCTRVYGNRNTKHNSAVYSFFFSKGYYFAFKHCSIKNMLVYTIFFFFKNSKYRIQTVNIRKPFRGHQENMLMN